MDGDDDGGLDGISFTLPRCSPNSTIKCPQCRAEWNKEQLLENIMGDRTFYSVLPSNFFSSNCKNEKECRFVTQNKREMPLHAVTCTAAHYIACKYCEKAIYYQNFTQIPNMINIHIEYECEHLKCRRCGDYRFFNYIELKEHFEQHILLINVESEMDRIALWIRQGPRALTDDSTTSSDVSRLLRSLLDFRQHHISPQSPLFFHDPAPVSPDYIPPSPNDDDDHDDDDDDNDNNDNNDISSINLSSSSSSN